ncbi:hypothetical protein SUGI_0591450 [Cryptomeria japonica]|nr:hypothetical protein SUGI_0591450 [Cryptomeria japonica]
MGYLSGSASLLTKHVHYGICRERSLLGQNKQPKEEFPSDEIAETSSQIGTIIHLGVGCDNCGLYPIMGKSQASACIVGMFNQHHKAEHQIEVVAERRPQGVIGQFI